MAALDIQAPFVDSWNEIPFQEQKDFYYDNSRVAAAFSGVRGAKTLTAAEKTASRILKESIPHLNSGWKPNTKLPMVGTDKPVLHYWIVAPTYTLVQESWRQIRSVFTRIQPLILHETDGALWLVGGILVERRTGRDEKQLQAARLDGAWVDECCTLPFESYLQVRNRLTDRKGWLILSGSPRPDSWAREHIWDKANTQDNLGVHSWTTMDNPYIPREEIDRAREELPAYWFERDFKASWDNHPGLIYNEFNPHLHVVKDSQIPTEHMVWYGAQDWGTASPGCFLRVGVHKTTGVVYVAEEIYTERLPTFNEDPKDTSPTWVGHVLPIHVEYGLKKVFVDVSDGSQDRIAYVKAGIPAQMATKGKVLAGIKVVQRFLTGTTPRLQISESCVNLLREIRAYCFIVTSSGLVLEKPDDKCDDHACLTERSLIETDKGQVQFRHLTIGTQVRSYNTVTSKYEYKPVIDIAHTGYRPVWRLTFQGGSVIEATPDHKLWTGQEWITVEDLVANVANGGGRMQLRSVEWLGRQSVMNMTVQDNHTYVSSGLIHKNCDALRYLLLSLFGLNRAPIVEPVKDNPYVTKPWNQWTGDERRKFIKRQNSRKRRK